MIISILFIIIAALYFLGAYSTYQYLEMIGEVGGTPMSKLSIVNGAIIWPKTALFMFWSFEVRKGSQ